MNADPDSGLLSPVRAGTPAEAATGDLAWVRALLDTEAALARAQAATGLIPRAAAEAITEAAASAEIDVVALARAARETANPVVGLIKELTEAAGTEYVHRGSTSQDIFDTAMMLVAARTRTLLVADLEATADALASLARAHRDTLMAGRTLTAHAVPTTFGLKAAGWRQLTLDALDRLNRVVLPVSLGGAAGTRAAYAEYARLADLPDGYPQRLQTAFAEETGLAETTLPWHTLRTPTADLAAALAFTAAALGKIAVDVQFLTRTEVGEVTEPAGEGRGGSSAMPHKRNPVLATLIRSAALQVPVLATGVTQAALSEDERSAGAWHAEWQLLRECLRLTGGAAHTAAELARGLVVHDERMRENLGLTHGQIVSERLSTVLAPLLGKARAKEALGRASKLALEQDKPLGEVLSGLPEITGVLPADSLAELLDPANYTGSAGALVDAALDAREENPKTP
ncbi:adenylosuccinate lyase family protein [Amycolatopsis roodepoortensis]|uniref:3-carboxy-cis,cis-muconate cycloisomerase n=1 Tax=Amycolatopsis roodepoortensis TaxID=700274 RepID=A0ABR9LM89_9PSEU|nr:adenylosuccinate lyase family protein [Amycolatopsis roodepoortensis]MBE1581201.1 3-carboxy-cis,cis-muconate cycloisomerase [Amycolatopsis roodepoortensis]